MSLQIKITGKPGEGKSTLGRIIQEAIAAQGLNVKLTDEESCSNFDASTLALRVANIKARNGVVEISTEQTPKQNTKEN